MELRQLRHFDAVYRLRSVSRAAEEQHLTQSALSRSLLALERDLGQKLFDRSTHEVAPTQAAEELIVHAVDALAAARSLEESATVLGGGGRGTVRLGTGAYPFRPLVTTALRRLSEERPGLQVTVSGGRPGDLVAAMVRRELDAVVCDTSKFESVDRRSVAVEPLAPEPLAVVVAADHPLTGTIPDAEDLAGYPWALPPMAPASVRRLPRPFTLLAPSSFPRYLLDSATACLDLAGDGRTVTMVPLSLARVECGPRGLAFAVDESSATRDGIHLLRARTAGKPTRLVLDAVAAESERLERAGRRWLRATRDASTLRRR